MRRRPLLLAMTPRQSFTLRCSVLRWASLNSPGWADRSRASRFLPLTCAEGEVAASRNGVRSRSTPHNFNPSRSILHLAAGSRDL